MDLSKKVFEVDQVLKGAIPFGDDQCRFDYKQFEHAIKDVIRKKSYDENATMADIHEDPRMFQLSSSQPKVFTPTDHPRCFALINANVIVTANAQFGKPPVLQVLLQHSSNLTIYGPGWSLQTVGALEISITTDFFKVVRPRFGPYIVNLSVPSII